MQFDEKNRPQIEMWTGKAGKQRMVLHERYQFDGNVLRLFRWIDPGSQKVIDEITPTFDESRRLKGGIIRRSGKLIGKIELTYDSEGRLRGEKITSKPKTGLVKSDKHDSTEYLYDENGRVVEMIDRQGGKVITHQFLKR